MLEVAFVLDAADKSPKSVVLPVLPIVIYCIVFLFSVVRPPANIPLVLEDVPATSVKPSLRLPKSEALPVELIVT